MAKPANKLQTILAFGFEAMGFEPPFPPRIEMHDVGTIEFVEPFDSKRLDDGDAVICLQGLFDPRHLRIGPLHETDIPLARTLPERFQQAQNLLREGGWLCFLVNRIRDELGNDMGGYADLSQTDLCKLMLNDIGIPRQPARTTIYTAVKDDAFRRYARQYGTAHTIFEMPYGDEPRRLIFSDEAVTGFEHNTNLYFLPFYTSQRGANTTAEIVTLVSQAVHDYRLKRIATLPQWLNEFAFPLEAKLNADLTSLKTQYNDTLSILNVLTSYKSILTTSNDLLKNKLVEICEDFFGLQLDPLDDGRQDFMLLDDAKKPLAVIEAKGTKGGVQRPHIQQLDSHRTTNGLDDSVPGVLLINNQMDRAHIEARVDTDVAVDQIKYARYHNCLIVRTIDFLFLMKHLWDSADRGGAFLAFLDKGGGWLKVDNTGPTLISDSEK